MTSTAGVLSCGPTFVPNIVTTGLGVGGMELGRQELTVVHRGKKENRKDVAEAALHIAGNPSLP